MKECEWRFNTPREKQQLTILKQVVKGKFKPYLGQTHNLLISTSLCIFNTLHAYRLLLVKSFFVVAGIAPIWNNQKASRLPVRLYSWL